MIQMATGLGKTVTFANVPHQGKVLILSHREELVHQPLKYFNCSKGIEMADKTSNGEEVISASVQSLVRRLDRFKEDEFDLIITDEAHHAAAKSYRTIYNHFKPRLHLGFTATPNRADSARLDDIFSSIIFQRDLRWGIENEYLSDIHCLRVDIGYDLRGVKSQHGDYAPGELDKAMDGTADAIAQAYRDHAHGATLIFAVSVEQVNQIAAKIPGAVAVTGETDNRSDIIADFTARKIPVLVNCMVFTEGTDIPLIETIIIARPTQSDSLYAQMVGRGLRTHPDKEILTLIDCVGVTGKASLCTAPSLLGLNVEQVPKDRQEAIEGLLFDLPTLIARESDTPASWIRNVQIVNLWAKGQRYQTHNVNWFQMPDGSLVLALADRQRMVIPPADELGQVTIDGRRLKMQEALDMAYRALTAGYQDQSAIWDAKAQQRWGSAPASEKQLAIIQRRVKNYDTASLTKGEASMILNRLMNGGRYDRSTASIDFVQMVTGESSQVSRTETATPHSEWWKTRRYRDDPSEAAGASTGRTGSPPAGFSTWVS